MKFKVIGGVMVAFFLMLIFKSPETAATLALGAWGGISKIGDFFVMLVQ